MVESVTWVARLVVQAQLPRVHEMATALGLVVLAESESQIVLQTQRGDVLEYCTPAHPVPDHLFADQDTVIGFLTDDVDAAGLLLAARGFEALGAATSAGTVRFRHFRGADGLVYGLIAPSVDR